MVFGKRTSGESPRAGLSLSRTWYGSQQSRADGLRSAGQLQSIVLVPGVLETTLYGPFVDAARARGRTVYAFSYDWRRDNLETLARLGNFVHRVSAAHNRAQVDLVAHSQLCARSTHAGCLADLAVGAVGVWVISAAAQTLNASRPAEASRPRRNACEQGR